MSSFGARVRAARQKVRLSLRETARLAGIDYTYLSKIETGNAPSPKLPTIYRLAGVLEVSIDELLGLADERIPVAEMRRRLMNAEQRVADLEAQLRALTIPDRDADAKAIADWVVSTCLLFGTSVETAYHVAGLFVEGIARDREKRCTSTN